VLEPFASGITTALISITAELSEYRHVVIHGSRAWVDTVEKVKARFPGGVEFIEWKNAAREIRLGGDFKALGELISILKAVLPRRNGSPAGAAGKTDGAGTAAKGVSRDAAVVHLHSSKAGFLGRAAARLLGITAVVYTPHCGAFLRTDIGGVTRRLYMFFERLGGLFGGRLVGCGPSEAEIYRRLGPMYKNAGYVSNGVVPRPFRSGAPQNGKNLVSFSGIASPQKDPALFNAIAANCKRSSGVKKEVLFYWIGEGPEAAKLDKTYVTLTGWKSPAEVAALLEKTTVYLSCSAWEGLPYGVLEAMNASCALLLRDVPGNRDLVVPGENGGLFTDPEEACELLREMLADPERTAAMGRKSRTILERDFSQKAMGEGYRRVYAEVLGHGNSPGGRSGRGVPL
jgi:glycosyltransferase involved in cell wall biosynthesis